MTLLAACGDLDPEIFKNVLEFSFDQLATSFAVPRSRSRRRMTPRGPRFLQPE